MLVGDLQFPTAVDDIGLEVIEGLDFRVAGAVTQILLCDVPESVTLDHGMDAVGLRSFFRVDDNTVIGENISTGIFVRSRFCVLQNAVCANLGFAVLPGLTHTVIAGSQLFRIGHHKLGSILGVLLGIGSMKN